MLWQCVKPFGDIGIRIKHCDRLIESDPNRNNRAVSVKLWLLLCQDSVKEVAMVSSAARECQTRGREVANSLATASAESVDGGEAEGSCAGDESAVNDGSQAGDSPSPAEHSCVKCGIGAEVFHEHTQTWLCLGCFPKSAAVSEVAASEKTES